MLLGALIWAYVIASFVDIIINYDPDSRAFRNALDALNRFLNLHSMPQENPKCCAAIRDYFHHTKHLFRARSHASLYALMSPTMQGTVVRQIPWHSLWISRLEGIFNAGRTALFKNGDRIRVEKPVNGVNYVTHLPTGIQVERQDFNAPVQSPVELELLLVSNDERVGASVRVSLEETYARRLNTQADGGGGGAGGGAGAGASSHLGGGHNRGPTHAAPLDGPEPKRARVVEFRRAGCP